MFRQHGAVFPTLSRCPGDAALLLDALWPLVGAASQEEAGVDGAEVKVGEVCALSVSEEYNNILHENILHIRVG